MMERMSSSLLIIMTLEKDSVLILHYVNNSPMLLRLLDIRNMRHLLLAVSTSLSSHSKGKQDKSLFSSTSNFSQVFDRVSSRLSKTMKGIAGKNSSWPMKIPFFSYKFNRRDVWTICVHWSFSSLKVFCHVTIYLLCNLSPKQNKRNPCLSIDVCIVLSFEDYLRERPFMSTCFYSFQFFNIFVSFRLVVNCSNELNDWKGNSLRDCQLKYVDKESYFSSYISMMIAINNHMWRWKISIAFHLWHVCLIKQRNFAWPPKREIIWTC